MASKRPSPEQFAQPARKCRRTVDYAAQQIIAKDDSSNDDDSSSEFKAPEKDNISETEDEEDPGYKDTSPPTKRIPRATNKDRRDPSSKRNARTVTRTTNLARRILLQVNKRADAVRKDSAISIDQRQQVNTVKQGSMSSSTLAENKPWVPLTELIKRPDRVRAEDRPWVPLFPTPPASTEKAREYIAEGDGNPNSDDDDDDNSDDDYNDDEEELIASTQAYPIPEPIFSIMDPLHPNNPSNFRSCMEHLPEEQSEDENAGKTAAHDEDESSEYTGEDDD